MAKTATTRKQRKPSINMAAEIRRIISRSPKADFPAILDELKSRFPNIKINRNSAQVSYYQAKKKQKQQ